MKDEKIVLVVGTDSRCTGCVYSDCEYGCDASDYEQDDCLKIEFGIYVKKVVNDV